MTLAGVAALELDDPLGGAQRRRRDRGIGRQLGERCTAGVDDLPQIAAVLALRIVGVVVHVRCIRVERDEQRLVQPPAVGGRLGARLLTEHVQVVVGRLQTHHRARRRATVAARHERRERGRALDVAPLALGLQRRAAQQWIGDLQRARAAAAALGADARKHPQPVAPRSAGERHGEPNPTVTTVSIHVHAHDLPTPRSDHPIVQSSHHRHALHVMSWSGAAGHVEWEHDGPDEHRHRHLERRAVHALR